MNLNREPIKNWFGFTRRERRSSFILLIVIVLILGLRVAVPEKYIDIEDITDSIFYYAEVKETDIFKGSPEKKQNQKPEKPVRRPMISGYQKRPLINLNSCDTSQLISLPGIGPVLSVRIIKYRNLLGGFASVEQLREVYRLSAETFDLIKGRVYADSTDVVRININEAVYRDLSKLPYFEKYEVTAILKYRALKGRIGGMNDLTLNKLIPVEKVAKVRPYLRFK